MPSSENNPQRRAFVKACLVVASMGATGAHASPWSPRLPTSVPPIWTLTGHGGQLHLLAETPPRRANWHDVHIERLFDSCSSLWTETNQEYKEPQADLIQRLAIDPKRPLSQWLDQEDKRRLALAAAYCKVSVTDLEPYRPWCAVSVLQDAYYVASGATGTSADRVLRDRATRNRQPTYSEFPTKDDVFAWFARMTPDQELQFFRYTLDEILAGPEAGSAIYDAWQHGNPEPAAMEVARYTRAYPALAEILTAQRNERWMPRFSHMLETPGTAFVVVGLYHIVGPQGLLALAKQQGITVAVANIQRLTPG